MQPLSSARRCGKSRRGSLGQGASIVELDGVAHCWHDAATAPIQSIGVAVAVFAPSVASTHSEPDKSKSRQLQPAPPQALLSYI
jgi:hypothetical protein